MISAKIIAHSISHNIPLITMELCYPRFIHSEVMTHRMFSRNASSSRAIPIEKMIDQVRENPSMPIHWGKNQPGMQAREECNELVFINYDKTDTYYHTREDAWRLLAYLSRKFAENFASSGYHKQVANRLLEPFQWIKVIVTATEWDNFFVLRLPYEELNDKQRAIADSWKERFKNNPDGKDAQPEIQELARCMKKAMDESTPVELKPGEWHLPYVRLEDHLCYDMGTDYDTTEAVKCSVARCARVSYNNHDMTVPDIEKDIALADRLLEAGHMSPFEHQAAPMPSDKFEKFTTKWIKGVSHYDRNGNYWSGNFRGWIQYRQLVNN